MAPSIKQQKHQEGALPPRMQHNHHHQHQQQQQPRKPRTIESYIPKCLQSFVYPYHGDFCYTPYFHPRLIAQLMAEGFLPIATEQVVLPKLHELRSVIPLASNGSSSNSSTLHISKQARKKSKRYKITINTSFDAVVAACHDQHGEHCWLYPELVQAFAAIHRTGIKATVEQLQQQQQQRHDDIHAARATTTSLSTALVRLYSIEVWNIETNQLAAGELGYAVGSIYTSLTGFACESSAGSVQLAALGKLLTESHFVLWDLGMDMNYKQALGAQRMPRTEFVALVHAERTNNTVRLPEINETTARNCRDIIDEIQSSTVAFSTRPPQEAVSISTAIKHSCPGKTPPSKKVKDQSHN